MLAIEATRSSPRIVFHEDEETLEITGESYPENSFEFFGPVFSWLQAELPRRSGMKLRVHVSYMNSSSTKCMLDILDMFGERAAAGAEVSVQWLYEDGNERALELAEEFREDLDLPFEIRPIDPEPRDT